MLCTTIYKTPRSVQQKNYKHAKENIEKILQKFKAFYFSEVNKVQIWRGLIFSSWAFSPLHPFTRQHTCWQGSWESRVDSSSPQQTHPC
jgi:hypothetical protein